MPIDKVLKKDSVKYIKGSHRWGKWFIPKKFETNLNYIDNTDQADSQHEFCEMINIDESNYEALAWDLEVNRPFLQLINNLINVVLYY